MGDVVGRAPLTVGQELWFVPNLNVHRRGNAGGSVVKVAKIGRKWATLEGWPAHRIDLETWAADGGDYSSPGRCFASEEAYRAERERQAVWEALRSAIPYRAPDHLTTQQLRDMGHTLGINIK